MDGKHYCLYDNCGEERRNRKQRETDPAFFLLLNVCGCRVLMHEMKYRNGIGHNCNNNERHEFHAGCLLLELCFFCWLDYITNQFILQPLYYEFETKAALYWVRAA